MHGFIWKSSIATLAAVALLGSAAVASAEPMAHHRHAHAPFGASTIGRGIAGQHDHFTGAHHHHHHYGDYPYGASTMGRGIAGYHSRH